MYFNKTLLKKQQQEEMGRIWPAGHTMSTPDLEWRHDYKNTNLWPQCKDVQVSMRTQRMVPYLALRLVIHDIG